ncbi:ArsR family transcriptional regulator [Rhodophyticola sp. CCM32]|uniref:ArsR/SmtB family transcription factor n=1 Tax=Rhodophyticola sp. CCM32 TaxID=2916397 RepID=UPI00107F4F6E|nr:metalloregulator ArsR/SmtB family transcription factor [Rhodophyticola sp. CCM32]QBY00433.1 ArsR family transcriptional regulator [Rhodophyticola sp. CCM32]QBY01781.1 ArsR family transcriptional regulator [Rhodophyticola sp. CCM32]
MIVDDDLQQPGLATTFASLGDPRRLALIARLQQEDSLSVSSLCEGMNVSRQAVSKHLKTLTEAQLVSAVKSGRETRYSLELPRVNEANEFLVQIGTKWDRALERLKTHVE